MKISANRMPLIDALKAIASQLIVLHHLSSYGPLAEAVRDLLPQVMEWLFQYGRIAVQIFLVVGGFLAARGLSAECGPLGQSPLPLLWKRYQRLVVPFVVAIAFAIICSAIANHWMDDDAIPARATFGQWLSHVLLLHGILGADSLSAGVWYVAIDFQLFALFALLLWAGKIGRRVAPLLVLATAVASLFWFNRDADFDNFAVYFFGSYGLGVAAWWASDRRRLSAWMGVILTVAVAALVLDFRLRIAVALATALLLGFSRRTGLLQRWPDFKVFDFLGRISYSVFLVHFPIYLVTSAMFVRLGFESAAAALIGMAVAWGVSLGVGTLFHRWVESPEANQRIAAAIGALISRAGDIAASGLRAARQALRRVVLGEA